MSLTWLGYIFDKAWDQAAGTQGHAPCLWLWGPCCMVPLCYTQSKSHIVIMQLLA